MPSEKVLGKAGFLSRDIAPLLDDRLLDLPWVGPGPGADLLGNIDALLGGLQLGHKLGDMLAGPLGLKSTLLLGGVLHDSLDLVIALLPSFLESTTSRSTQLPRLLCTSCDGSVLLHALLGDIADLLGPFGAVCGGGIARGVVLTFLLDNGFTFHNIILDIMDLLLGPTLGLIFGPADLRALHITVLHQRGSAHIGCLVEGNLLILDETVFPEVLITVFLLLGLVLGHIGRVASPVIGMVTLDHLIILCLLNHLHLVDTPLAIPVRPGRSN